MKLWTFKIFGFRDQSDCTFKKVFRKQCWSHNIARFNDSQVTRTFTHPVNLCYKRANNWLTLPQWTCFHAPLRGWVSVDHFSGVDRHSSGRPHASPGTQYTSTSRLFLIPIFVFRCQKKCINNAWIYYVLKIVENNCMNIFCLQNLNNCMNTFCLEKCIIVQI